MSFAVAVAAAVSVSSAIAFRTAVAFSKSPGAASRVVYAVMSVVDRESTVIVAVSLATAVPCSDRSVRSYVPGGSGSVLPVTESTVTPGPVVTNSDGESGDAYVLIEIGVGPVSVVVSSSVVVVLLVVLFRIRFRVGTL
ncbi:hypothetical protein [Halorubrum sp. AS12]|uniref:hypothetical protein n=1 Tax=Halorubrum sp. AS12 TaxID=3409687 RepID=UPI003DA74B9A